MRVYDATEDLSWTKDELDEMSEILVKADEIRADEAKYRAVTNYMKNKSAKIRRISDLRLAANDGKGPNRKEETRIPKDRGY